MDSINSIMERATSFADLPDMVLFEIFKQLDERSLRNGRLVCTKWYSFIHDSYYSNFELEGTLTNNNNSISILKSAFQTNIRQLTIKNLSQSLPIFSSTRIGIPTSTHVILQPEISEENIMKLLRSYCVSAQTKELTLRGACFLVEKIGVTPTKAPPIKLGQLHFKNLTTLNISLNFRISEFALQHLATLNQFLRCTQIPQLTTFSVLLNCALSPNEFGVGMEVAINNFHIFHAVPELCESLGIFINNHGGSIKEFDLCLMECDHIHMLTILPRLKPMTNLEVFKCSYTGHKNDRLRVNGTDEQKIRLTTELENFFNALQRIKSVVLMTSDTSLNLETILGNARGRLHYLSLYVRGFSQLSWLHQPPSSVNSSSNLRILDLYFSTRNNLFAQILTSNTLVQHKLLGLRILKLLIYKEAIPPSEPQPPVPIPATTVYQDCFTWITEMCPNLGELRLNFYADGCSIGHGFTTDELKRMLVKLKYLNVLMWNKSSQEDEKFRQLKNWYDQSPNVKGIFFSSNVKIKNYRYTNFVVGPENVNCIRINRNVFNINSII